MLFLLLAMLSSAMVSIVMRTSSNKIRANLSMLAVNYVVCALLGAVYADFRVFAPQEHSFILTVGLGALGGYCGGADFAEYLGLHYKFSCTIHPPMVK